MDNCAILHRSHTPRKWQVCKYAQQLLTLHVKMNRGKTVPSDPEFLLKLIDELPSDDSHDDFDGYLTKEEAEAEEYSSTQKNKIMVTQYRICFGLNLLANTSFNKH